MLLVAVGGMVGSVARYLMTVWLQNASGLMFPVGTLAVNILGSFLLGLVMTLSLERGLISAEARLLLGTGLCGGFTTMSTFSYETFASLTDSPLMALGNVALTLFGCLVAVWLGSVAGRSI
ncbi:MAG: fluoride efflux transporter CrcB [bacterium]